MTSVNVDHFVLLHHSSRPWPPRFWQKRSCWKIKPSSQDVFAPMVMRSEESPLLPNTIAFSLLCLPFSFQQLFTLCQSVIFQLQAEKTFAVGSEVKSWELLKVRPVRDLERFQWLFRVRFVLLLAEKDSTNHSCGNLYNKQPARVMKSCEHDVASCLCEKLPHSKYSHAVTGSEMTNT